MDNKENDIWKGKENININTKSGKITFNRHNLKRFYTLNRSEIRSGELLLDYFDKDSLSQKDEETGCYLSHLLFLDGYDPRSSLIITNFLFDNDYLSPYEINDKGQLYTDCIFQSPQADSFYARKFLERAIENYSINFENHVDFQGNNIAHWINVSEIGSDYPKRYFQYYPKTLIYGTNKNGISVNDIWELSKKLFESNYMNTRSFIFKETENHIILTIYRYTLNGWNIQSDIDRRYRHAQNAMVDKENLIFKKDEILLKFINNWYEVYRFARLLKSEDLNFDNFDTFKKSLVKKKEENDKTKQ